MLITKFKVGGMQAIYMFYIKFFVFSADIFFWNLSVDVLLQAESWDDFRGLVKVYLVNCGIIFYFSKKHMGNHQNIIPVCKQQRRRTKITMALRLSQEVSHVNYLS